MKLPSLSIIFPAYNDATTIPLLIAKAKKIAKRITDKYEIIIVNDGSTDDTKQVLQRLAGSDPAIRLIHHKTNQGYGAAVRSGLKTAKYTWVFYTDGDGQYDPMELVRLVSTVNPHVDVVNGYKSKRSDSLVRTLIGSIYNFILHGFESLPIRDVDCDFRLIRAAKLRKIHLYSSSGMFPLELIKGLRDTGARFVEVPVHHYPRAHGTSEFFRPKHLASTFKEFLHRV